MTRTATASESIMERARALFPGGVNSPVRAFRGVGGEPFVVARGEGARIWDADDREYIDYVLSWGPLVLGHAPAVVTQRDLEMMEVVLEPALDDAAVDGDRADPSPVGAVGIAGSDCRRALVAHALRFLPPG